MAIQAKDCHAMTSYFVKKYKAKYGMEPNVNRHSARWSFASVLEGLSPTEVKALIDYYFTLTTAKRHTLEWFFYNYHQLIEARQENEKDRDRRERLRRESEQRAREWRERFGNQGITDN